MPGYLQHLIHLRCKVVKVSSGEELSLKKPKSTIAFSHSLLCRTFTVNQVH